MNLSNRGPLGLRQPKPKPDPAYLARIRQLPCVICNRRPCEAHHCIHDRYSQRRVDDRRTIPLCPDCHRDLHANKAAWRDAYGADHEFLAVVADMLAGEWNE